MLANNLTLYFLVTASSQYGGNKALILMLQMAEAQKMESTLMIIY